MDCDISGSQSAWPSACRENPNLVKVGGRDALIPEAVVLLKHLVLLSHQEASVKRSVEPAQRKKECDLAGYRLVFLVDR